jgi:branched-subunit amino acid transport protein
MISTLELWTVIVGLGVGSFAMRFAFLGVVGDRQLPAWVLRHLRYTAAAILPALVAPLVLWPSATDGTPDPPRLAAATIAFVVGYFTKNVAFAILSGAGTLYALLSLA